jgi:hypothetical protein
VGWQGQSVKLVILPMFVDLIHYRVYELGVKRRPEKNEHLRAERVMGTM